jgi:hypothetical protein
MLPSNPQPLSQYWIDRGLVFVSLGNGIFWTKTQGWTGASLLAGGPKKRADKFGVMTGFGATYGTGTADRVDAPVFTTSVAFRSLVTFSYALSVGGGNLGRVFQQSGNTGSVAQSEALWVTAAGGRELYYTHAGTSTLGQWSYTTATSGPPLNVWMCYALTHDCRSSGNDPQGYRNGIPVTMQTESAAVGAYAATSTVMNIGNRDNGATRNFDGTIGPLFLFDHPSQGLTAHEHFDLAQWPELIFQQEPDWFFGIPGSAGSYTLATVTGTYADTGTAASVRAARLLALAQGSFALSGQTAGLSFGHKLPVAQGAYTYTGQSLGLAFGRQLPIVQGSYTDTGQSVAIRATRTIAAVQGAYTDSGQNAALRRGFALIGEQGSYSGTGNVADLIYSGAGASTYTVAIGQGSYSVAGEVVALKVSRKISTVTGTYADTGQPVLTLKGYSVTLAQGSYSDTGSAATLKAARYASFTSGSYSLTGYDTVLTYSADVAPAPVVLARARSGNYVSVDSSRANLSAAVRGNTSTGKRHN